MNQQYNITNLFGYSKLKEFQKNISSICDYSVSIIDFQGNTVIDSMLHNEYCANHCPLREECNIYYAMSAAKTAIKKETQIFTCPKGLYHISVPIFVNNAYHGSVICGQVLCSNPEQMNCAIHYHKTQKDTKINLYAKTDTAQHMNAVKNLVMFMIDEMIDNVSNKQTIEELEHMSVHLKKVRKRNHILKNSINDLELFHFRNLILPQSLLNYMVSLSSMAILEDASQTEKMIAKGISILRYYLNQKEELIYLEYELQELESYLFFIKSQNEDSFSYKINPDHDLYKKIQIPIFSLFSFLEYMVNNMMYPSKFEGTFQFTVKEETCYDMILMKYIHFNMQSEEMINEKKEKIMKETDVQNQLKNTLRRYELLFGEEHEITFLPDGVEIKIPKFLKS